MYNNKPTDFAHNSNVEYNIILTFGATFSSMNYETNIRTRYNHSEDVIFYWISYASPYYHTMLFPSEQKRRTRTSALWYQLHNIARLALSVS